MKKWKKILLFFCMTGLVAGGIVFYFVTKRPDTAADSKPIREFTAVELFNELTKDHHLTDSLYKEKNIAVSGKVIDIKETTVFMEAGPAATINCSFDSTTFSNNKALFLVGSTVNIKGIYSGSAGFDAVTDPDDMLAEVAGKNVLLKTCALHTH